MFMKCKNWKRSLLAIFISLTLLPFSIIYNHDDAKAASPTLTSGSAIVISADSGQILYEYNAHQRLYPASITKILTALVALEQGDLNSTITMSEEAVYGIDYDATSINLQVGEQINFKDALYATMLVSANEAAWGIAEQVSGSLQQFCDVMNARAKELGCEDTHFVNANGLHSEDHYTTAYDMALITREALKNETFREITGQVNYTIPATNMSEPRDIVQGNRMKRTDSDYYYEYCLGGKTGYTDQAGATLVTWSKKGDMEIICVVMNSNSSAGAYEDSIALSEYCFNNYTTIKPLLDYSFSDIQVQTAEQTLMDFYGGTNLGSMYLSVDANQTVLLPSNHADIALDKNVTFSTDRVAEGIIGTLTVSDAENTYLSLPITFSGYINSEDPDAVAAAIAQGIIEDPDADESGHSLRWLLILFIIIIILAAITGGLYLRMQYVQRQRELYRRRRDEARRTRNHF